MKRSPVRSYRLAACLFACLSAAGADVGAVPLCSGPVLTADTPTPVRTGLGRYLRVRAAVQPSTGAGWNFDRAAAKGTLEPVFGYPKNESSDVVGAAGVQTWCFMVVRHGTGVLRLDRTGPAGAPVPAPRSVSWPVLVVPAR